RFAGDPHDADGRALSELRERDRVTIRFTYDALTGEIVEIEYLTIEPVRGDLDADRECGVTDVILLQKWLLRAGELPDAQSADLNADGTVDVFDLAMLKHLLFV
ncbi:MAG: dockerin type I repeat-containing protein, partial [Oscillospiraceae bacterium]|nr:dockerin type I repeat-containing protein [Oscillospiraceae bacterium]